MKTLLYVLICCGALVSTLARSDVSITVIIIDVPRVVCGKAQNKAAEFVLRGGQLNEWSAEETQTFLNETLDAEDRWLRFVFAPTVMRTVRRTIAEMRSEEKNEIAKMIGMKMVMQSCTQELRQKIVKTKPPQKL